MPNDPTRRGGDRKRINAQRDDDLDYWSMKWGVSRDDIKQAISKVGPKTDDVAAEIGEALFFPRGGSDG